MLTWFILVSLIYIIFFLFIKSTISGSFVINQQAISFDDVPNEYYLQRYQPFSLDIDYEAGYTFSDNTDLFDIDQVSGIISFTPFEVGEYTVVLLAFQDPAHYKVKAIRFIIDP